LGVKRTSGGRDAMSTYDPKRTSLPKQSMLLVVD
jgi:hypothetical protein